MFIYTQLLSCSSDQSEDSGVFLFLMNNTLIITQCSRKEEQDLTF